MAKRSATTELNHDNWDREEEPEEVGMFQKADQDILKQRVIKTAKRRVQRPTDGSPDAKPSIFSGFSGFGNTNTSLASTPFSFLSQNAKPKQVEEKNASEPSKETKPQSNIFSNSTFGKSFQEKDNSLSNLKSKEITKNSTDTFKPFENVFKPKENEKSKNLETLRDLNLDCSSWIAKNLEKNPYIILTPIFEDYKKHLAALDLQLDSSNNEKTSLPPASNSKSTDNSSKVFTINPVPKTESLTEEKKDKSELGTASAPKFQFSVGSLGSTPNLFGGVLSSTPTFSLNQISKPPAEADNNKNDEESEEPPKNEFVPVVEEDSIFDIRCKVFIKKDKDYVSKGVGTLFIKPVQGGSRNQVLVRADTSLGNILLNFLLTPSLTIQKMGSKDVMVVCLPTPESKPPPIPVLIRVKTSEDCDKVIKKLEECKGS